MSVELDRLRAALADSYAIDREIGQGGHAIVYLATDLKHDRDVASDAARRSVEASLRFVRDLGARRQAFSKYGLWNELIA